MGYTLDMQLPLSLLLVFWKMGWTKGAKFIAKQMDLPINWVDPYSKDYENNLKNFVDNLTSK